MEKNTIFLGLFILFLVTLFYCFNKNENNYFASFFNNNNNDEGFLGYKYDMNTVEHISDYDSNIADQENDKYEKILEKLKIIQDIIAIKKELEENVEDTNAFVQENIKKSLFKLNEEYILLERKKDDELFELQEGFKNHNKNKNQNQNKKLKINEENQSNVYNLKKSKDKNSNIMCDLNKKYFKDNDSFENLNLNKSLLPLNNQLFIN